MPCKDPEKNRANVKRHYEANKEYYRQKNTKARLRKAEYIREQRQQPCADCGIEYPFYVMEFDHIDPKQKEYSIAGMTNASWTKIKAEIQKCELICANCHAIRTYNRH